MSNLAQINEQLQGMSADFEALEKSLAQSERERHAYERSSDRMPELVREGALLADKYKMDYLIVCEQEGPIALCAADAADRNHCLVCIPCQKY